MTPKQYQTNKNWIKALRSGKFKQTSETLRSANGGYCCLGVLACVAGRKYKKVANDEGIIPLATGHTGTLGEVTFSRLTGFAPEFEGELVVLNDHYEASFKKIASVIENALKKAAA